jgi:mRNA interferase MazF
MKGEVVVVPFPFSALTATKRRPALVVATLQGDDLILCQITSQVTRDAYSLGMADSDFERGALKQPSNLRPNRLFTADSHLILYSIGQLKDAKIAQLVDAVVRIIKS